MSRYDHSFLSSAQAEAALSDGGEDICAGLGDRHQLLLEAAHSAGDIDLLSLMPSVDRKDPGRSETRAWLSRILGI